jgi:hypothetical protein
MVFGWDRYVISYGVGDQSRIFARLSLLVRGWVERFRDGDPELVERVEVEGPAALGTEATSPPAAGPSPWWLALPFALLLALLTLVRSAPSTARRAYQRLRRQARLRGVAVDQSVPPNLLRARLAERFPDASAASGRLVDLYLEENYAERRLSPEETKEVEALLAQTRKVLRRAS